MRVSGDPRLLTMRWLILALVLMSGVTHSRVTPHRDADNSQIRTKTEQRGSDQSPLAVKIIPSPEAHAIAAEEEKHREESAAQEKRVADATYRLVVVTAILALFTGGLWFATYRLARDARDTSKRQADEMQRSLSLAERSADLAQKQLLLEGRHADIIEKQHAVVRMQFFATHRPRIIARNVIVKSPTPVHGARLKYFATGALVSGQLYIENVGSTDAHVVESHCEVYWTQLGLPMERPYEGKNPNNPIHNITLIPGQSMPMVFQSEDPLDQSANDIALGNQNWKIFVMGWVEYTDQVDIRRRTIFCREFRTSTASSEGRFFPINDVDYDRAD